VLAIVLLLSVLAYSAGAAWARSGPASTPNPVAALRSYLAEHAQGTQWHFVSGTRAQVKAMEKMVRDAAPLPSFAPHRLIKLVSWHPAAGYPGMVTADLRIVFDPERVELANSSVEWIARFRAQHPVKVDAMTDAQRKAYLAELVSMIPRRDSWGFKVVSMKRTEANTYQVTYEPVHPISKPRGETTVEFDDNGAPLAKGALFAERS